MKSNFSWTESREDYESRPAVDDAEGAWKERMYEFGAAVDYDMMIVPLGSRQYNFLKSL